jgi:5-methylcytosine-specific restriction enzyme subunit McrC
VSPVAPDLVQAGGPQTDAAPAIPIRNIYYLLSYAWGHLEARDVVDVGGLDSTELVDLFAHVLIGGTNHVLRRGLDRGYLTFSDDIPTLRGKIDVTATVKRSLLATARAHCHFDELSHNVLHNQILKTTIGRLARTRGIDVKLAHQLRMLHRRMSDVDDIPLSRLAFHRVQLHRNNAFYDFLMKICELVQQNLLAEQHGAGYRFRDFHRDEDRMAAVFEDFVTSFFSREQSAYKVAGQEWLAWKATPLGAEAKAALPGMKMDIVLRGHGRTIIIDTKYYRDALKRNQHGTEKVKSENLYQLYAYLRNIDVGNGPPAEGMLLYPTVTRSLDLGYVIDGHSVRICTIDLAQDWQGIRRDMLRLLEPVVSQGAM